MRLSICTFLTFCVGLTLLGNASAQQGVFDDIKLKDAISTLYFHPNDGDDRFGFYSGSLANSLDFDTPENINVFRIFRGAPNSALVIRDDATEILNSLRIGTVLPSHDGLSVYSDGFTASNAKVSIYNNEETVQDREQLRLRNNGPARFGMANDDIGATWSFVVTSNDQFQIRKNGVNTPSFAVRQDGTFSFNSSGVAQFGILPTGNAFLKGTLFEQSDRNSKTGIVGVDSAALLEKVSNLQISEWSYRGESETRHIGPMAQDFREAFGVGASDKTIATLDVGGVALASIQELSKQNQTLKKELASQRTELQETRDQLEDQRQLVSDLLQRLERLEAKTNR